MKLTVKSFNSNATIFGDGEVLDIHFDGFDDFTFEENIDGIKANIQDLFGSDIENMDEVLTALSIKVSALSKRVVRLLDTRDKSFEIEGLEEIKEYLGEGYENCNDASDISDKLNEENAGCGGYYIKED